MRSAIFTSRSDEHLGDTATTGKPYVFYAFNNGLYHLFRRSAGWLHPLILPVFYVIVTVLALWQLAMSASLVGSRRGWTFALLLLSPFVLFNATQLMMETASAAAAERDAGGLALDDRRATAPTRGPLARDCGGGERDGERYGSSGPSGHGCGVLSGDAIPAVAAGRGLAGRDSRKPIPALGDLRAALVSLRRELAAPGIPCVIPGNGRGSLPISGCGSFLWDLPGSVPSGACGNVVTGHRGCFSLSRRFRRGVLLVQFATIPGSGVSALCLSGDLGRTGVERDRVRAQPDALARSRGSGAPAAVDHGSHGRERFLTIRYWPALVTDEAYSSGGTILSGTPVYGWIAASPRALSDLCVYLPRSSAAGVNEAEEWFQDVAAHVTFYDEQAHREFERCPGAKALVDRRFTAQRLRDGGLRSLASLDPALA